MGQVGSVVRKPLELANHIKNNTDLLDKSCKVIKQCSSALKAGAELAGKVAYKPLMEFAKCCGIFSTLVGALNLINRAFEWICKGKKNVNTDNDYSWKSWKKNKTEDVKYEWMKSNWSSKGSSSSLSKKDYEKHLNNNRLQDDGYWTWMKTANRVGLTAAHTLSLIDFLSVIGLFVLGPAGLILSTIKNVIYLPCSALDIADGAYKVKMAGKYVENSQNKVKKWTDRTKLGKDQIALKYNKKITDTQLKLDALKARMNLPQIALDEKNAIKNYIHQKTLKMGRWKTYITESQLSKDGKVSPESQLAKDCQFKIKNWVKNVELTKSNAKKEKAKNWIGIAYNIAKVAMGIISLVGLALTVFSLVTCPVFAPAFLLAASIGWAGTELVGLSKECYGFFNPTVYVRKPHLVIPEPLPQPASAAA